MSRVCRRTRRTRPVERRREHVEAPGSDDVRRLVTTIYPPVRRRYVGDSTWGIETSCTSVATAATSWRRRHRPGRKGASTARARTSPVTPKFWKTRSDEYSASNNGFCQADDDEYRVGWRGFERWRTPVVVRCFPPRSARWDCRPAPCHLYGVGRRSREVEWVGADSNCRPAPCEGAVITGLDHQPDTREYPRPGLKSCFVGSGPRWRQARGWERPSGTGTPRRGRLRGA